MVVPLRPPPAAPQAIPQSPHPHPIQDFVEIAIGGRLLRLSLTFGALVEFERRRGKNAGAVFAALVPEPGESATASVRRALAGISVTDVVALLHCMLMDHHPDIDEAAVARMITWSTIAEAVGGLQGAVAAFLPEEPGGRVASPFPQAAPTGMQSGAAPESSSG